jgi:hypothetical protein
MSACIRALATIVVALNLFAASAYPQSRKSKFKPQPSHLYPVSTTDKQTGEKRFGFIDNTGKLVIDFDRLPMATTYVGDFHEGRAVIHIRNESWVGVRGRLDYTLGYIDETGKVVVAPRLHMARDFSEGLAFVERVGFRGFIDLKGKEVVNVGEYLVGDFHEGLAAVTLRPKGGGMGVISSSGNLVVEGMQQPGDEWGYIDRSGKLVIKRQYEFADNFSEGLAGVAVNTNYGTKYGFINKRGEMVIAPRFGPRKRGEHHEEIIGTSRFVSGLACVKEVGGLYGYINQQGDFVIRPQFDRAQDFSEGLAWVVTSSGKIGWIDTTGRWVVTGVGGHAFPVELGTIYSDETVDWRYSEGLVFCFVYSEGTDLRGYMDQRGEIVIKPRDYHEFGTLNPFSGGVALVYSYLTTGSVTKRHYGYIDKTGHFIWRSK